MGGKCCAPGARPSGSGTDAPIDSEMKSHRMKQVMKQHFKPNHIKIHEKAVHKALKKGQMLPENTGQETCQCCGEAPPSVTLQPCTCCGSAFCSDCIDESTLPQYNIRALVKVCCACIDMIHNFEKQQRKLPSLPKKLQTPRSGNHKGMQNSPRSSRSSGTPRSNRRTKEREMLLALKVCCITASLLSGDWLMGS